MMRQGEVGAVARQFRRIFGGGSIAGLAEWELLRRYLERGDEDAFGAIVARHGPMVLGVCRRVLGDSADSEDAFQVTFLTLARKAGTLGEGDAIGSWLYGVAHRVALRARTASARRRNLDRKAKPIEAHDVEDPADRESGSIVAEELAGLPAKYRAPMVLCYIEGLTHEEAGRELGWPVGTIKGRLSRARDLLKGRLSRRGLDPARASNLALLLRADLIKVPQALAARTTRAALDFAAGRAVEGLSASAVALLDSGVESMFWIKLKAAVAVLCVFGGGAVVLAYQQGSKESAGSPKPASKAAPSPSVDLKTAVDSFTTDRIAMGPVVVGGGFGELDPLARLRDEAAQPIAQTPKNNAISSKLGELISMNFPNPTPLEDIKKYIEQSTQDEKQGLATGIPIYVDPQALAESGRTMASTVSINLEGVPLKVTLGLALKQLGLGYRVKDGVLIICSAAETGGDSPLALMLEKAERAELTKAEYKELIEILKLRKEVIGKQ